MASPIGYNLLASEAIVDREGKPTLAFQRKWQEGAIVQAFTLDRLPSGARAGAFAYVTDLRVFNGAGVQETAGNGTGGHVTFNGQNWVITGTNITAVA